MKIKLKKGLKNRKIKKDLLINYELIKYPFRIL